MLGRAQTGSGKTLAFGLPILARLAGEQQPPQAPARADHRPDPRAGHPGAPLARAAGVRRRSSSSSPCTAARRTTARSSSCAPAPTSSSPRRAGSQDLMDKGHCRTDDVADHRPRRGRPPVRPRLLPGRRQAAQGRPRSPASGCCSRPRSTVTSTGWSARTCASPVLHELDPNEGSVTTMAHHVLVVGGFRDKVEAAVALVEANPRSIVFTRTREGATELAEALGTHGIEAVDLHGNLSQRVRERNLHKFSSGKAPVVVATDVAARGIHVDNVGLVVHFDAAGGRQGLPAPLRPYGAGRRGRRRRLDHHAAPGRRRRAAAEPGRRRVPAPRLRTTPRPMTAEALATSGSPAPQANKGGSHRGQPWPSAATAAAAAPAATGVPAAARARAAAAATGAARRAAAAAAARPATVARRPSAAASAGRPPTADPATHAEGASRRESRRPFGVQSGSAR